MKNSLITTGREALLSRMRKDPSKATQPSQPQPVFHKMATIAFIRLTSFLANLAYSGIYNEYEDVKKIVISKTGDYSLLKNPYGPQDFYEMKSGFDKYTYLAAFEALYRILHEDSAIDAPGSRIKMGKRTLFNYNNHIVRCVKEKHKLEGDDDIHFFKTDGIIEIIYYSPDGSFSILQDEIEPAVFTLWYSENMSIDVFKLLCRALDKSYGYKEGTMIIKLKESGIYPQSNKGKIGSNQEEIIKT